jgi:4-hydroxybenzoate polyprenyltransferase
VTPIRAARTAFAALRPHQWAKNVIVWLPLIAIHPLTFSRHLMPALLAFAAFSLIASAGYVLNDIVDLPSDRRHRTKSARPFASRAVPLRWRFWLIVPCVLLGGLLSLRLPAGFSAALAAYGVLSALYTLRLKRIALLDVVTLAVLYTLRLAGGALAVDVELSSRVFACSMCLFVSLALVKRVGELRAGGVPAREYRTADLPVLRAIGVASGCVSVVLLALCIHSAEILQTYRYPQRLLWLCGFLLIWLGRVWIATERDRMHADPVVFALRDAGSYWIALLCALVLFSA